MSSTANGSAASKICLGTWRMGGDVTPNPANDDGRDIEAIRYAISKGISHIDTSESYAGGKSELLIGEAIRQVSRDACFIATKVREYNLSRDGVIDSCRNSLKRLGTSYIDLYYVHKQNPEVPIEETASALNALVSDGLVRNIGLSNVGIETIERFSHLLSRPLYAVQNQYNLVCRESQRKGVLDYCRRSAIRFIAWRPILLSYPGAVDPFYKAGTYELLDHMAAKYAKTNTQIVARWLLQQDGVSIVFKSSTKAHIDEIVDALEFELSEADWALLDEQFPVQKNLGCTADTYYSLS